MVINLLFVLVGVGLEFGFIGVCLVIEFVVMGIGFVCINLDFGCIWVK